MLENICVVIRSCGERTTELCKDILESIFQKDQIFIINASPFSKAIISSFDIGVQTGKDWLLCIDADVLVLKEGILKLINNINNIPKECFQIQGLVADKFFPVIRPAGNHLYRMAYVEKAKKMIPNEGNSLRPETDMLNKMSEIGFSWMQYDAMVGIHDFEQSYIDIFRKCFLQAHKHDWLLNDVEKYWLQNIGKDKDFLIAMWGAFYGKLYQGTVLIDKNFSIDQAQETLMHIGIEEKEPITNFDENYIDQVISKALSQVNSKLQYKMFPVSRWNTFASEEKRTSFFKELLVKFGRVLIRIGKRLERGSYVLASGKLKRG